MPWLVMIFGGLVVLSMLIRAGFEKTGLPALVGYLLLGFLLKVVDARYAVLSNSSSNVLEFSAQIGLVTLLFRIGLESKLKALLGQLRRAAKVWASDVIISGLIGFVAARYVLGLDLVISLVLASAFTATSVGLSLAAWRDAGALDSPNGRLLLDVAELDDISAIIIMGLLFSVLPVVHQGGGLEALPHMGSTAFWFLVKMAVFGGACALFSFYGERPLTDYFRRAEKVPAPMILVVGVGLIIAALAGILGFSLAIGAFFAGLVFSRDPDTVKMEGAFLPIYDLFSPFFFIGVGLGLDVSSMTQAAGLGLVLTVAAVLAKLLADGLPVGFMSGTRSAALIGASMIPRAEITMVIVAKGRELGDWAVPPLVYGAMVLVSALTCIISPPTVKYLLGRWPQEDKEE